jgi:hypothetical protein
MQLVAADVWFAGCSVMAEVVIVWFERTVSKGYEALGIKSLVLLT